MPLTHLQKDILAVLAANRSEESHFAGGIVLNVTDDSARYSHDYDIFHELAGEVTRASNRDVESLRLAGFEVDTPSRNNEWKEDATFRKARVSRGNESVEIDWAADSAFRYFPIERDPLLGWRLHLFDIATNKGLWLHRPAFRPLAANLNLFEGEGVAAQSGKKPSFDLKSVRAEAPAARA